ncbi:helix-turn-helix transcriptional regulator [Hymenobacter crusticola]|uniref:AraC family transcriptional regulator n=1 Tax=Hymenobacter crusticola TaxID=1770526 RepID=A0A243W7M3_9BACT|nr:helix-turn-helix transcriptional regulator [Hymenobacter crusticola]OUJ71046.1 AraC family transcriptional regulator [Hymenobacter crusticola]
MKIAVTDTGSGIALQVAQALGATVRGRFIDIPASKGGGYITGFTWGTELRMMVRHYYLHEAMLVERTDLAERPEEVVFLLRGILPSVTQTSPSPPTLAEPASVLICPHAASSVIDMPANTRFNSVTIAVSRSYLRQLFGELDHPLVASLLATSDPFVFETGISPAMLQPASDLLLPPVPESLASPYCKLKCEELLCHTIALLLQREAIPPGKVHLADLQTIYALKLRLQASVGEAPPIADLAKEVQMSEPKLRKLFRQTFGKSVFDYYQTLRMQEAARLLKEQRLTVSEVGYQVGYTNLSHFARVFEQHIGLKPKKYSAL